MALLGEPDQATSILDNDEQFFFLTEDGRGRPRIHGRNRFGQYFTTLESPIYDTDETTGLSFSPDNMHQFCVSRRR
jgi:hypothetical protein